MKRTTVMLPETLIDAAREHVGGQGLSPLVRDLLTVWLGEQNGEAAGMNGGMKQTPTAPKPVPTKVTKRAAALTDCAHRNKERLGYMTRCGDCGEKLR